MSNKIVYLVGAIGLTGIALLISQLNKTRKPRQFRDDPVGALKDQRDVVLDKAHAATDEAVANIQESLDELRGRLTDFNRQNKRRQQRKLNKQIDTLNKQMQRIMHDLRATALLER